MVWSKSQILHELRSRHKSGRELSYNRMARVMQPLVSAAAYHFGSYRSAVEQAGIDYATVARRPYWTRVNIIKLIKQAKRRGDDLNWSAVIRRRDDLGRAAFAALQPRLFGRWDRALQAAGLDVDEVSRYRHWGRQSVAFELRSRAGDGEAVNSGALQRDDPGLHAAAVRYFGTFDDALRGARLDPAVVRRRRHWTREGVIAAIQELDRRRSNCSDSAVRRSEPALYGAAVRLFGAFIAARAAAGVDPPKSRNRAATALKGAAKAKTPPAARRTGVAAATRTRKSPNKIKR